MNRRWVCSDVWLNILPFFDRPQLGLQMALLSYRFDALVDKHFDCGKTELTLWNDITICYNDIGPKPEVSVLIEPYPDEEESELIDGMEFPLPNRPLPNKIRFKDLLIEYIDHTVLAFLRSNKQIFGRIGINLELSAADEQPIWDVLAQEIWPIFATHIRHLCFTDGHNLDILRRRISLTILTDLDQLDSISFDLLAIDQNADDGPNATAGQVLAKWLHTPRKNGGQPKELYCEDFDEKGNLDWINSFKETFLRATTSVSYNIRLILYVPTTPIETFELVNNRTKEKLTLIGEEHIFWLLKRCPISGGTATAIKWDYDKNLDHLNRVFFSLGEDSIGPLSLPADQSDEKVFSTPAGPSDQRND